MYAANKMCGIIGNVWQSSFVAMAKYEALFFVICLPLKLPK